MEKKDKFPDPLPGTPTCNGARVHKIFYRPITGEYQIFYNCQKKGCILYQTKDLPTKEMGLITPEDGLDTPLLSPEEVTSMLQEHSAKQVKGLRRGCILTKITCN